MPKIKVIRPTEEIKKELAELEENIQTAAASIKEMKTTRRTLRKELELAQAKEAEEKQAEEIKELTELMKEKQLLLHRIPPSRPLQGRVFSFCPYCNAKG